MRQRAIKRAQERIARRLRARHQGIRPVPEQGLFNFRCHENCVEYLRTHPDRGLRIAETVYLDGGEPILHYVVVDGGRYLEVTLGWRAEQLEYYLIRVLDERDHTRIHSEFDRSLTDWLHDFTSWFDRAILRVERVL